MPSIINHPTIADFLSQCQENLEVQEVTNGLMLGLTLREQVRNGESSDIVMRSLWEGEEFLGALIQTPPHNLVLSRIEPNAMECLAENLLASPLEFPGIVGPEPTSQTFSTVWANFSQHPYERVVQQKIYQLNKVIPVQGVAGSCQLATLNEAETIAKWTQIFDGEALPINESRPWEEAFEKAVERIHRKEIFLWKTGDTFVSMAAISSPTRNGIRVNLVFTPPEHRGNGFGSANVAALSQLQLDKGKKFCFLYTDANYPTSNKIYQQLGYEFVCNSGLYRKVVRESPKN